MKKILIFVIVLALIVSGCKEKDIVTVVADPVLPEADNISLGAQIPETEYAPTNDVSVEAIEDTEEDIKNNLANSVVESCSIYYDILTKIKPLIKYYYGIEGHTQFAKDIANMCQRAELIDGEYRLELASAEDENARSSVMISQDGKAAKWVTSVRENGRVAGLLMQQFRVSGGTVYYCNTSMSKEIEIGLGGVLWSVSVMEFTKDSVRAYTFTENHENSDVIDEDALKMYERENFGFDTYVNKHKDSISNWVETEGDMLVERRLDESGQVDLDTTSINW